MAPRRKCKKHRSETQMETMEETHREEHYALKIPEILENILQHCSWTDLKACRRVSRRWKMAAQKWYTFKRQLVIRETDEPYRGSMKHFLYGYEFLEDTPRLFSSVRVIVTSELIDIPVFMSFWTRFGAHIKALDLSQCEFPGWVSFRDVLFKLCPNVQELNIAGTMVHHCVYSKSDFPETHMANLHLKTLTVSPRPLRGANMTWIEFFTSFPAVQNLQIIRSSEDTINEIFQAVNSIREQDPSLLKLRNIDARITTERPPNQIPYQLLHFILNIDFALESLSVTVAGEEGMGALQEIINSHGDSLTKLELHHRGVTEWLELDHFGFSITKKMKFSLSNLRELRMFQSAFESLEFLAITPNLRKLAIDDADHNRIIANTDIRNHLPMRKLTSLELGNSSKKLSRRSVQNLITWFPGLESLRVSLTNKTFALVCQGWPELMSLDMFNSCIDESGLTGLDTEQVDMINGSDVERPPTVPRANISALKNLRVLHIGGTTGNPCTRLGLCAAAHGILQLPLLNHVKLTEFFINSALLSGGSFFKVRKCNEFRRKIF